MAKPVMGPKTSTIVAIGRRGGVDGCIGVIQVTISQDGDQRQTGQ
jgi:hypothetical protein